MRKLIILLIGCTLFISCEQLTKSITDTFKSGDTVADKEIEKPNPLPQPDVNEIIKTAIEAHATGQTQEHNDNNNAGLLTNTDALKKAEEELRKLPQYAGKEIFVYSTLYFYNNGTINVMLQHPENPKYVDAYEYRDNKWSEPRPIQLSVRDEVKSRLVSLNKIHFINAAKVTEIYNKKAEEIEGAKPAGDIYISIWNNQIQWYPTTINGSRERYSIQFNDDGSLKIFKQD